MSAAKVNLTPDDLEGTWYAYYGTHPNYDCVDCKQFVLNVADNKVTFTATYRLGKS